MYLSLYCKGSKRVTQGLRVRGSWRPNGNFNILTSTLMTGNVVSFSFSRCSTGGPGPTLLGDLLHLISNFSAPQLNRASRSLRPIMWLSLPHLVYNSHSNCNSETVLTSVLTELYNSSTPTQLPTRSFKWYV